MTKKFPLFASSLLAVSALTTLPVHAEEVSESPPTTNVDSFENCYGIAKAHRNDCHTAQYTCAGNSKTDNDPEAWISVPRGLCNKIVGGKLQPPVKKK